MNQKTKIKFLLSSVLALGAAALTASAQDVSKSPQPNYPADSGYGLVGTSYADLEYGYVHHTSGSPTALHDYSLELNQNTYRQGITGVDANLGYDYITGSTYAASTHRQTLTAGLSPYLLQPWGKPFLILDGGWVWQKSAGRTSHSYQYTVGTGIEFQILPPLTLTPFVEYLGTPRVDTTPVGLFPRFDWNYGAKLAYRLNRNWGVSLTASSDSASDITYRAGLQYHF
jgi:opacity protein-like surface antigen